MAVISGGRVIGYEGQAISHTPVQRTVAGVPVDGTSGTFAGIAAKGDLLTDTTNAILYINTNTLASPTWTKVGTQT